MLYKIDPAKYSDFVSTANAHKCGKVYPLSIAEGIQDGEIYANSDCSSVLFWTHCGFAYLSGKCEENYFKRNENIILEKRYLFEYPKNCKYTKAMVPAGFELKEIDEEILTKISGNISPALFWKDLKAFLRRGKGYCITRGDDIASWAFSAAISSKEIDIGIETDPKYRQRGLGRIVAEKMIEYTIEQQKNPVWACHYKNAASEKMAEQLGFVKAAECSVIKSKD